MQKPHSFHIPVMGIGFTIDTPLKVASLGIDSVISLVDDELFEKLRMMYCRKNNLPYTEITAGHPDHRAARITAYLNMMAVLCEESFRSLTDTTFGVSEPLKNYIELLPEGSTVRTDFKNFAFSYTGEELKNWISGNISQGSIDVNIMTKIDKENYRNGEKLPSEYNDAHAALRGYANSDLESSLVLSAGMNPRLYSYIEKFDDFFPKPDGYIKKKIVLKVSDFRSASIQGKFLAKKGIWVSEYRIESGLNCGGHAFATDGYLMGPILGEFSARREELIQTQHDIFSKAMSELNRPLTGVLPIKITAQGGVGTSEEHNFLLEHYGIDSVGWGSPFLLVPEATSVDHDTLQKLCQAKEDDLYLSGISPLGVPFNSLRGNSMDEYKNRHILEGKPGSNCPKRYVALNKEYSDKGLCTASSAYQRKKIKDISALSQADQKKEYEKIVEKSCICVGLGTSVLLLNKIETGVEGDGVSICPGPNLAYFSRTATLKEMVDHIYGRTNIISRNDRPNFLIKELEIYVEYLRGLVRNAKQEDSLSAEKYLATFAANLKNGIEYYRGLFSGTSCFPHEREDILKDLSDLEKTIIFLEVSLARKENLLEI